MAIPKGVPSFDEIIQADRQRRKNEQLANEIFGKNKRASGLSNAPKKNTPAPALALASRISKAKRSSSTSTTPSRASFASPFKPPSRPSSAAEHHIRANRLAAAVNNNEQAHIVPSSQPRQVPAGSGLSIKGTAGPFAVQATNFAPGTTAADIEAAIQSVAIDGTGNTGLLRCRILTNKPTVIAEMVFSERYVADKVVKTFNNEKADGRILHVFLKQGDASPVSWRAKNEVSSVTADAETAAPSDDLFGNPVKQAEDVEMTTEATYDDAREEADRDRRNRENRREDPTMQNARLGFETRERDRRNPSHQEILPPRETAGAGPENRRRDDGRDRGHDSHYGSGRDESGSYRGDSRYHHNHRDHRPPRYGNGVANDDFRVNAGYGRLYSDDTTGRPPRGGRFGGPRSGYR